MRQKITIVMISTLCCLCLLEATLHLLGYLPAHVDERKSLMVFTPDSFLAKDDVLGWRLGRGEFEAFSNNIFVSKSTVGPEGSRITSNGTGTPPPKPGKKIYLFGCSFTFGSSVSDSGNYPYYLQALLPDHDVRNMGVPAYSPVQMYLSLKQEVENGNRPDVAVINYGSWQDERAALGLNWLRRFRYWAMENRHVEPRIRYPYGKLDPHGRLLIDYLPEKEWAGDWPLRDRVSMVHMVNSAYDRWFDEKNGPVYRRITLLCCFRIVDFCRRHLIKVAFYGMDAGAKPLLDSLRAAKTPTALASVDVFEPGFNCAPADPAHPNSRAHKIYAEDVFALLRSNGMIDK